MAIGDGLPIYDPWVVLAVMGMRTERIRLGLMLTPPSRRRPWKLARETLTIDHLTKGRLVVPVGLGAVDDGGFGKVGEATDRRTRAELLDEGLDILTGLWTGEPFSYQGKHYKIAEMTFAPKPVQSPRIPIWVAAVWNRRKSRERALRYDGVIPNALDEQRAPRTLTPDEIATIRRDAAEQRTETTPFDIIVDGVTPGDNQAVATAVVEPLAQAGATWWIESPWMAPNEPEDLRRRLRQGPPRL